jgi:hypothetical protein
MGALWLAALCLVGAEAPPPQKYEPTANFTDQTIEGWTVRVHKRLLDEKRELGQKALELLRVKLYDVGRTVPKAALAKLRSVVIWVEADNPQVKCMCYHPSRGWLEGHGFNPEKAKSVEIGNPRTFLDWSIVQPSMVLHELAHAYHHQVLGYDNPDIKAAFKRAAESKSYEAVLYYDGATKRAYALNSDQEYFAELSEAYFGANDFYPFVRPEVKAHDPQMFETLRKLWGKD